MTDYEFVGNSDANFRNEPELDPWDTFKNHREIITGFVKSSAPPFASTLCVLGAGFCRDIELNQLSSEFPRVTLVDKSPNDVLAGLSQQNLSRSPVFSVADACDVTGVDALLTDYKTSPSDETFESVLDTARQFVPPVLEKYDCVASTCLLSQLLFHATECVGENHPRYVELLQTIRLRHIQIILESLNPGGAGILITDFVSSESLPELLTTTDLKSTVQDAIGNKNFLNGLNPALVGNVFTDESTKPFIKLIRITDPWRWALPDRIYACFAVVFLKH